jgi:hypothetical protein
VIGGSEAFQYRLNETAESVRHAFRDWRRSKSYGWPPPNPEVLAEMVTELTRLEQAAAEDRETYPDTP